MADALVKLLNSLGYMPVFLPRTGLVPPELYNLVDGRLVRRGPLVKYLGSMHLRPNTPGKMTDIEHKETSGKNIKAAVSFLEGALRCIGITSAPKLDLSFAGGTAFIFSFSGVTYEATNPSDLDFVLKKLVLVPSRMNT